MMFIMAKTFRNEMKKKGNKKKKQTDRFYSSLLLLPYRCRKRKIRFHRFRNFKIAVTIVRFSREEKFSGLNNCTLYSLSFQ